MQNASITEVIDTTTPGGRLVFHLFGSLAEFERELVRERTLAGLEAARARGRTPGRPPKLGPKEIEAAKSMLSNPALTSEDVCRHLGVTRSTLYRHLRAAGWTGTDISSPRSRHDTPAKRQTPEAVRHEHPPGRVRH